MTPNIPSTPEEPQGDSGELRARIVDCIDELRIEEGAEVLRRYYLNDPLVFDEAADEDSRWDVIEGDKDDIEATLSDIWSSEGITDRPAPKRVFWRDDNGNPIETTLMRVDDDFALAYEVKMDDKARPLSATAMLWHGNEEAVEDFLASYPIKEDDFGQSEWGERLEILERLIEDLPRGRRSRVLASALLGVLTVAYISDLTSELGYMAAEDAWPAGGWPRTRRIFTYPVPTPKALKPPEPDRRVNQHRLPIRQPKPQSGARRGKRASR